MGLFNRNRTSELEAVANAPVGASVRVDGIDAVIAGTIVFENAGDRWVEHCLAVGDGRQIWVSIENFDTTVATRWKRSMPPRSPVDPTPTGADTPAPHSPAPSPVRRRSSPRGDRLQPERLGGLRRLQRHRRQPAGIRALRGGRCPSAINRRVRQLPQLWRRAHRRPPRPLCPLWRLAATVDEGQWGDWEVRLGTDVTKSITLS